MARAMPPSPASHDCVHSTNSESSYKPAPGANAVRPAGVGAWLVGVITRRASGAPERCNAANMLTWSCAQRSYQPPRISTGTSM